MDFHLNNHVICTLKYFSSAYECLGTPVSCCRNFNFLLRCLYDFLRYFYHLGLCQRTSTEFVDANLLCRQWALYSSRNCGIFYDGDFIKSLVFPAFYCQSVVFFLQISYNNPIF